MRLTPYLHAKLTATELEATSSTKTIESLVRLFSDNIPGLDTEEALDALLSREKQVPTGMENGIAIPHATIDSIEETTLGIALLSEAVDFGTQDGSLVRLVFMILSPQGAISTHIKLLARIARLCSNKVFIESLMATKDSDELLRLLREEDQRHV